MMTTNKEPEAAAELLEWLHQQYPATIGSLQLPKLIERFQLASEKRGMERAALIAFDPLEGVTMNFPRQVRLDVRDDILTAITQLPEGEKAKHIVTPLDYEMGDCS